MGESPTAFAARMGLSYGAFKNRVSEGSFATHSLVRLSASLNLSLDYICCLIPEPAPIPTSEAAPDFWTAKRSQAVLTKDVG